MPPRRKDTTPAQRDLFARPIVARFREFHAENPHVYARLVALCHEWRRSVPGRRLGIKMLWERLRWDLTCTTEGDDRKLNNDFTAHYARLIMEREPLLRDLFETRRIRS